MGARLCPVRWRGVARVFTSSGRRCRRVCTSAGRPVVQSRLLSFVVCQAAERPPTLSAPGRMLTEEQKSFFAENGYVLLDDVLTEEELDEVSREYDSVFARAQGSQMEGTWSGDWQKEAMPEGKQDLTVQSIHNLQFHSATFMRLLLNKRMLSACSDVMGTENILLHHTKAHVKPPGRGSPYPMHQDYHYFPYRLDSMLAVFVHLDDSDTANGCLAVYPGSHRLGPLKDCSTAPGFHHVDQSEFPLSGASPLESRRGQVAIFSYLLVHGSYPNLSERTRRMLLIQVMSAEDEPLKMTHLSPGQGLCLMGGNSRAETDIRLRHQTVPAKAT